MGKKFLLLLALLLPAFLFACGEAATGTGDTPAGISARILESQPAFSGVQTITPEDKEFELFLTMYYHIGEDMVADGAISCVGGGDAGEIAVLALESQQDAGAVREALQQYIKIRTGDFYGYMPDQVLQLDQAVVAVRGNYVALLICQEPSLAEAAFNACFTLEEDEAQPVPPGIPSPPPEQEEDKPPGPLPPLEADYDSSGLLVAWRTGDKSGLSGKDAEILDACAAAIGEVICDGMSDYEKELAIHDWIIQWAEYDPEAASHAPGAQPDPDNSNPYGLLMGRRATCSGYTSTFQLFMDLLDVECITVHGASRGGTARHSWNMVRLDGEWYCVDVTWNDPLSLGEDGSERQHRYFNVTSAFLWESDHQWDPDLVPEATATTYGWSAGTPPVAPFGLPSIGYPPGFSPRRASSWTR